jgi:hypothetical protein
MQPFVRSALVLALLSCTAERAGEAEAAAAQSFTRQYDKHKLHASVAGSDCRVLLITSETALDKDLIESMHYGTDGYSAFGGVEQLSRDRGFRAVVYGDPNGGLWTYGATTQDEARTIPRCR